MSTKQHAKLYFKQLGSSHLDSVWEDKDILEKWHFVGTER
jgi:hypothetical protein